MGERVLGFVAIRLRTPSLIVTAVSRHRIIHSKWLSVNRSTALVAPGSGRFKCSQSAAIVRLYAFGIQEGPHRRTRGLGWQDLGDHVYLFSNPFASPDVSCVQIVKPRGQTRESRRRTRTSTRIRMRTIQTSCCCRDIRALRRQGL